MKTVCECCGHQQPDDRESCEICGQDCFTLEEVKKSKEELDQLIAEGKMKELFVLSERFATQYECNKPHLFISIQGSGLDFIKLPDNSNRVATLQLHFDDIYGTPERLERLATRFVLFSEAQAREVWDFISKNDYVPIIFVNCQAGISRSAAVAAAIAKKYNGDDMFFFNKYHPNPLVYSTLIRIGGSSEETKFQEVDPKNIF